MKKNVVFSKIAIAFLMLSFIVLTSCTKYTAPDYTVTFNMPDSLVAGDSSSHVINDVNASSATTNEVEFFEPTTNEIEFFEPTENIGLTSANIRLYFVDDGRTQWYHAYRYFDLDQIEIYHEFIRWEDGFRIIFTTEATVQDFRFLSINWNENFYREDERLYSVLDVLYSLDELTPEMPFVVTGASLGCVLAGNGFSFVDEKGTIRYYSFLVDAFLGLFVIEEF